MVECIAVKLDLSKTSWREALSVAVHAAEGVWGDYAEYWEKNDYLEGGIALAAAKRVLAGGSKEEIEAAKAAGEAVFEEQPNWGPTAGFEAAEAVGFAAQVAGHPKAYKKWTQYAVQAALNAYLVGLEFEGEKDFKQAWRAASTKWLLELEAWRQKEVRGRDKNSGEGRGRGRDIRVDDGFVELAGVKKIQGERINEG